MPIPYEGSIPYDILNKKIKYKVSYTWQINGNNRNRERWFSIWTGEPVEGPKDDIRGIRGVDRILSEEEMKKFYEDGIRKREIK